MGTFARKENDMTRKLFLLLIPLLLAAGCVDVRQEIRMNHDGSGKIVEKIAVKPRGIRMMKGLEKRKGKKTDHPVLLSDEFFQKRSKSMGEVSVEKKEDKTLPNGTRQVEVTYAFKDISKVHLWFVPTMRPAMPGHKCEYFDGKVKFSFEKGPRTDQWGNVFREVLTIPSLIRTRGIKARPQLSPVERKKFEKILPMYQDMLKDFYCSIVIVAPIESFEERGMVARMPVEKPNRVVLQKIDGRTLARSPAALRMFLANTVPSGGYLESSIPRMVPGSASPWFHNYHSKYVRFCKVAKAAPK
jgi:hypothetical protein